MTGCGRSDDGGSDEPEQAAEISSGPATGTVTVWAMGTEGTKLDVLAKELEKANPDATVKVTPLP